MKANQNFEGRVLGFERLKFIMDSIGAEIKLYGSCACGIAIENSDVDVAIAENILNYYPWIYNPHEQVNAVFEYLQAYLLQFPWISDLRIIPSAFIPIIKLTIDTEQPFYW